MRLSEIIRNARQTYRLLDEKIPANLLTLHKVSCTKGCAACCHKLVGISFVEALVIAEALVRNTPDDVDGWLRRLDAQSEDLKKVRDGDYPACVFLKPGEQPWTGTCSVYSNRPIPCRLHFVVSPVENCMPGGTDKVSYVDTSDVEIQTLRIVSGNHKKLNIPGPMAPMVAEAIRCFREARMPHELFLIEWCQRGIRMTTRDRHDDVVRLKVL